MKPDLLRFWAKTTHDAERSENAFHPLVCHLIDVGTAALMLWNEVLPDVTKTRLAQSFAFADNLDEAGNLIAFLVALHDLGKCSPPFALRGLYELKNKSSLNERLKECSRKSFYGKKVWGKLQTIEFLGLYRNTVWNCETVKSATDAPHNFVTAVILPPVLRDKFEFPPNLADNVAEIIGGHHGTFPDNNFLNNSRSDASCGGERWREAQTELTETLAAPFGVKETFSHLRDEMISELAPADLLLQRAGRLQRHERYRLCQFKEKTALWLIKPPLNADGSLIVEDNSPDFGKSGAGYDKHILLRS